MQQGVYAEYEDTDKSILDADYQRALNDEAAELTDQDIGDRVFPHFIARHLPPGLTGLLIAAVFAAAMSTVSTSLNSSATLLMSDYYRRFFRPRATEKQCMLALYASTIAWGILGTGMALILVQLTESALDIWWTLSGIFGGGMCGLFLLGMISRRAKNPAAVTGVIVGVLAILWMSFPKLIDYLLSQPAGSQAGQLGLRLQQQATGWLSPFHAFMVPVVGTLTILLVGLLISRVFGSKSAQVPVIRKE
jgi:SSS family solute:Na+ symporter